MPIKLRSVNVAENEIMHNIQTTIYKLISPGHNMALDISDPKLQNM